MIFRQDTYHTVWTTRRPARKALAIELYLYETRQSWANLELAD